MAKIDCIKVNADYEMVLFHGKSGPPFMSEALEFLAFYLQDLPVYTTKEYSQEFLSHVTEVSGRVPKIVRHGHPLNWWGPLTHLAREKWLNSKLTSFQIALTHGWTEGKILTRNEVLALTIDQETLVKDPHGMSGKGLIILRPGVPIVIPQALQGNLIVEPLLKRKFDFSTFVFPDGNQITYQNLVDEKFQYRGTLFSSPDNFSETSLRFYRDVAKEEWEKYRDALNVIRQEVGHTEYGYSVDSFVHDVNGNNRIHILSEVNARRTMGLIAFEMMKLTRRGKKTALTLKKPYFEDHLLLSPSKSLFEIYLSFS